MAFFVAIIALYFIEVMYRSAQTILVFIIFLFFRLTFFRSIDSGSRGDDFLLLLIMSAAIFFFSIKLLQKIPSC